MPWGFAESKVLLSFTKFIRRRLVSRATTECYNPADKLDIVSTQYEWKLCQKFSFSFENDYMRHTILNQRKNEDVWPKLCPIVADSQGRRPRDCVALINDNAMMVKNNNISERVLVTKILSLPSLWQITRFASLIFF